MTQVYSRLDLWDFARAFDEFCTQQKSKKLSKKRLFSKFIGDRPISWEEFEQAREERSRAKAIYDKRLLSLQRPRPGKKGWSEAYALPLKRQSLAGRSQLSLPELISWVGTGRIRSKDWLPRYIRRMRRIQLAYGVKTSLCHPHFARVTLACADVIAKMRAGAFTEGGRNDNISGHRFVRKDFSLQRITDSLEEIPLSFLRDENVTINLSDVTLEEAHTSPHWLRDREPLRIYGEIAIVRDQNERARPYTPATIAAETRCAAWLCEQMRTAAVPEHPKAHYEKVAKMTFNVSQRAFIRAWEKAVRDSGKTAWTKPGRRPVRNQITAPKKS